MASSSARDDQVVSRASVILENQSDWKLWYSLKKEFATVKGVWEYCDPSTNKLPPTVDDEPSDTASDSAWRRWEIKTNAQKATLKAIGEVNLEITRTVARSKLHLITNLDLDVRLRLRTLQDHFRITNQQQILELSSQYAAIQQKRRNQNVDTWLNEYSRIASLCQSEDMAEMKGTRPQWAFIQAVEAQGDADWSNQHFTLMIGCEEDKKDPPTLEALINRYRRWIATKRTHTKTLGSFAAKDSTQATQATLAITDTRPNNRPQCVCGLYHNILECYTLNETAEGRPEGFRPNRTRLSTVRTAFKDRELLKKIKKLYKDNNVRWTFDTAQNSDRSEKKTENKTENKTDRPTSASRGRRPYADYYYYYISIRVLYQSVTIWIVDPGSNVHICNSTYFNWRTTSNAKSTDVIFAGATSYQVAAWGEVIINVNRGNQKKDILLTHVAYVPGFLTNLFALGRCRRSGIHFDSGRNILYKERISNVVANLEYSHGHWLLDAKEADRPPRHELLSMAARSSQEKAPQTVTAMRAHQLLGHPSYQALEHLQDATTGLKIGTNGKGDPWTDDCVSCIQGKMKEDISRRPRADKACRPFYRISIDIIQLQEHGAVCYNGDVWALHAVCEYTKFHEICTLRSRHKATVVPAIIRLINKIERVYGYQVAIVFMDGDVGYGRAEAHLGSSAQEELSSAGIKVEMRSPDTPAQLGGAERAGAVIVTVARVIRIHAGLPKALANELVCTAVRLLNVTPTKALGWLIRVRDVRFIDELYKEKPSTTPVEPRIIETVHIPEEEYDGDTIVVAQPVRQRQEAITTPVLPLDHVSEKEYDSDTIAVYQKPVRQLLSPSPTPAFEGQDRSPSPDPVEQQLLQESSALMDSSPHRTPGGWNNYDDDAEIYIPDRHQNNAPQRRDPNLSQDNIITGRRRRQAHYIEAAPDLSKYFAFSATIAQANDAISAASQPTRSDPTRIHRDDLPPPPRHWKELKRHAHGKQFEAAAYAEFNSCWKKGTFAKPDITADTTDAVPLMWVFTYKFDEDGYLLKYKARIVVRGDLQDQYGDTYAATLAARLF
ncbi:Pol protein [Pyrenophora tritici-repentis]|nr:Pol protein [Pyrenophora tritici-repentis]